MDDKFYGIDIPKKSIVFRSDNTEMLRVGPEGFYVRGVKVEQGPNDAEAVYNAIKQMVMWDILKR